MNKLEKIQKLEIKNVKYKINNLQRVKLRKQYCKVALEEYQYVCDNTILKKEWLKKHFDAGYYFEEFFDKGDFFDNEFQFKNGDLKLIDDCIFGFSITVNRSFFQDELDFKILFERLFYEEKLLPKKLEKITRFMQKQIKPF